MSVRTIPATHIIGCDTCPAEQVIQSRDDLPRDWTILNAGRLFDRAHHAMCPKCAAEFKAWIDARRYTRSGNSPA